MQTTNQIEAQIKALEFRLNNIIPDLSTGKFPKAYYAIKGKIAKLKIKLQKSNWNEYLAQ